MKKIGKNAMILWICAAVCLVGGLGCFAANVGAAVFGLVAAAVLGFFGYQQYSKFKKTAAKNESATTNAKTEEQQKPAEQPAAPKAQLNSRISFNGSYYELKYHYNNVSVACVDTPECQPAAAAAQVGDVVTLLQDAANKYDNNAVSLSTSVGLIGYLYKGKLQDMANDFIKKGLPVVGVVENSPAKTVLLGFYDIPTTERNIRRLKNKASYDTYKLTANANADMQENIDNESVGDPVSIEYDAEKGKFLVVNEYGAPLGYLPASALEEDAECEACVASITQNDSFKSVIVIAIFNYKE